MSPFEMPSADTDSTKEKPFEFEAIPQEYKAAAALACGVLWGAWKSAGKHDISIPMGFFSSLDIGSKPNQKEKSEIEEKGWLGTMIRKAAGAYKNIDKVENILRGNYEEVLREKK